MNWARMLNQHQYPEKMLINQSKQEFRGPLFMELQDQQEILTILNAIQDPVLVVCNRGENLAANAAFTRRYSTQLAGVFSRDSLVLFKNLCKKAWQSGLEEDLIVTYDQAKQPRLVNLCITRLTLLSGTVLLTHWRDKPVFSTMENAGKEVQELISMTCNSDAAGPIQQDDGKSWSFGNTNLNIDQVLDDWPMPTYTLDTNGRIIHGNKIFARSLGIDHSQLSGKFLHDSKSLPLDTIRSLEALHQHFLESPVLDMADTVFAYPNGSPMKVRAYFTPIFDKKQNLLALIVLLVDHTEEIYLQEVLRASEERWQLAVNATSSGFCDYIYENNTLFCSRDLYELLGITQEDITNKDLSFFVNLVTEESITQKEIIQHFLRGTYSEDTLTIDTQMLCSGNPRWVRWRLLMVRENGNEKLSRTVIVFTDMNEQKQYEKELADRAYLDPLTHLPNRVSFKKKLSASLMGLMDGEIFAVVVLDLDGFKSVNDTQGHQAGDQVLQAVASRILESVGQNDFVARVGGDEFFMILEGFADKEEAIKRCETVLSSLRLPIELESGEATIAASLGVAFAPLDSNDMKTIMRMADMAMYEAKKIGKNCVFAWDPKLQEE